jgi:DNA-binding XRE family transcriptional regulator
LIFDEIPYGEIEQFHKLIASNVRKYREQSGYTQLQLALSIGHNSSALIAKAETGAYNKHFNIEQIYKISKVLDVSVEKFLILEEEK